MLILARHLDQLPRDLTGVLRLVAGAFDGFSASWDRLMIRNANHGAYGQSDDDDILWDSGEPDEPPAR